MKGLYKMPYQLPFADSNFKQQLSAVFNLLRHSLLEFGYVSKL